MQMIFMIKGHTVDVKGSSYDIRNKKEKEENGKGKKNSAADYDEYELN